MRKDRFASTWLISLIAVSLLPCQSLLGVAEPDIQKVSVVTPSWSQPMSPESRGDLEMARQNYRQAIEDYREAPEDSAATLNKIGMAYHHLLAFKEAKMNYQRALRIQPQFSAALNNLGAIFYEERDYHKAEKLYRKALKLTPNSAVIYGNLGTAYLADRKFNQALKAYRSAFAIDPQFFGKDTSQKIEETSQSGESATQDYVLAELFAKFGMKDQAIEYLRKALDKGFDDRKRLREDPQFVKLRNTPEFTKLMAEEKLLD